MGFFKTRKGRLRVWVYILLCLIIVPAAGFGVAMVVQPERFARDDETQQRAKGHHPQKPAFRKGKRF